MKAVDVREFDVRALSDVTDYMLVASGTSDRHVKSIAERVVMDAKQSGVRPYGVEGLREGEWVLVDLPDVLVHVMQPRVREMYALEQLWAPPAAADRVEVARPRKPAAKKRKAPGASKPRKARAGGKPAASRRRSRTRP